MIGRAGTLIGSAVGFALIVGAIGLAIFWFSFRVYVPADMCVVLTRKSGEAMPAGQILAGPDQKGIQLEVLGPGRYFYNPFFWEWEYAKLTEIEGGKPDTWEWVHTAPKASNKSATGGYKFRGEFPQVGVLTRLYGEADPENQPVVSIDSPYKGVIREVLTPGVYRINPKAYNVEKVDAAFIPAGFVGVVTRQFGERPERKQVVDAEATALAREALPPDAPDDQKPTMYKWVNELAVDEQSGVMRDVLQPGIYYLNPYEFRVQTVEVGYNRLSQFKTSEDSNERIAFPSSTGFIIELGVTVIWGVSPDHAPDIINEFGNVDAVQEKVIQPQLRSICRNRGSQYAARDFIQGERREEFQQLLTVELHEICAAKNVELLLALIHDIDVRPPEGASGEVRSQAEDLKRQIQESNIAIERQLTNQKLQISATMQAKLEEAQKKVDIAREQIASETRVKVARLLAEGEKEAATITAQTELEVASIDKEIADLDAAKREILGKADADVERFAFQAHADGRKMMVEALGSPQAYNLYTFANRFEPQHIQLFFAGEGTFWTDLTRLQDVADMKILSGTPTTPAAVKE